ncbi:MAG: beta-lactamase family protein [Acidobacteriota bacterium]|nr:beta-lactamase family protein [Acidobacteriota bacterium]
MLNRRHFNALAVGAWTRTLLGDTQGSSRIDETLSSGVGRRKIPAAVGMVATESKTLYQGAFGTRDSSGVPIRVDSIFGIASMTKAITTVAALQLVEQGKVKLDEPVSKHLPKLENLEVLDGFDPATGKPILRPARTPITLKHLLTHTSGLCYDIWDGDAFRYTSQTKGQAASGKVGPLMFEPGTRWQYGLGVDWAGRLVEAVSGLNLEDYFQTKILGPLEMRDTSYILAASKFERLASSYQRQADATLKQDERKPPAPPKEFNGGGGLYSTTGDYVRFMQMILRKGRGLNHAQILAAKTVESMEVNQIGESTAGKMKSYQPDLSSDVDMQPGSTEKWGLGFLINTTPYPGGRSAGSLAWAGLRNTFFWIDPKRSLCAVLMMQFLPFVDKEAMGLLGDFERAVYATY